MPPKKNKCSNGYSSLLAELRRTMPFTEAEKEAARLWPTLSAAERNKYKSSGKNFKPGGESKQTCLNQNIDDIKQEELTKKAWQETIHKEVTSQVKFMINNNCLKTEYIHIMHINSFFTTTNDVVYPAEIALVRFNLLEGVINENVYHAIIKPGKFPIGYMASAKTQSEQTHKLQYLDVADANMDQVCKEIFAFLTVSANRSQISKNLPLIYVKDDFKMLVQKVLLQFGTDFGFDTEQLMVCDLSYLLFNIRNDIANKTVWPSISQSINELDRDVYDYTREIPCEYHQEIDAPVHCSRSQVIRMAFIICDNCCEDLKIRLIPGRHIPLDSRIELKTENIFIDEDERSYNTNYSYAESTSSSRHTRAESLDLDDTSTVVSDTSTIVSDDGWCTVRSNRLPRAMEGASSRGYPRPRTNWRDTAFGQGRGRGQADF